ncbi:uncharacterized protein [Amphiura filiformis]|uniref:uncharacterized protein isoform X2 n=1 Tax=Amphiura filiformis TaxID=82378 RepID=UPI003B2242C8
MAASYTDSITWSSVEYSLSDLKNRLPIFATIVSNSSTEDSAGNRTVYQLKRVETIETIVAYYKLPPPDGESVKRTGVWVTIPKDYRAPFKVLPFKDYMRDKEATFEELLATTPRKIKVIYKVQRAPAWIKLDHGCELEVLGTKMVASKDGKREILRLQNSTCPFTLNPDCGGKFQVVEDDTEYTLTEIIKRFPLPQKVALARPEKHSDNLLELASPNGSKLMHLLLKRESQEEYIIGEDTSRQTGIVANVDADVKFYIPEAVECIPHTSLRLKPDDPEVLRPENLIYKRKAKPVVCKPLEQLFNVIISPSKLPPRLPRPRRNTIAEVSREDNEVFENTPVMNMIPRRKLDRSASVPNAHSTIGLPSSRPQAGGRMKMLTRDETKRIFSADNRYSRRMSESEIEITPNIDEWDLPVEEDSETDGLYEVVKIKEDRTEDNEDNDKKNEIEEETDKGNESVDEFIKENEYELDVKNTMAEGEDGVCNNTNKECSPIYAVIQRENRQLDESADPGGYEIPTSHRESTSSDYDSPKPLGDSAFTDYHSTMTIIRPASNDYDSPKSHEEPASNDDDSPRSHEEPASNDYDSPKSHEELASNDYDSPKSHEEPASNDYDSPKSHEEPASNDYDSPRSHEEPASSDYDSPRSHEEPASSDYDSPKSHEEPASSDYDSPKSHEVPTSNDYDSPKSHGEPASSNYDAPKSHEEPASNDYDSPRSHGKSTFNDYDSPKSHEELASNDYDFPKSHEEPASNDYDSPKSHGEPASSNYDAPKSHEEPASNDYDSPRSHGNSASNEYDFPKSHGEPAPNDYDYPKSLRESDSNDYDFHISQEKATSSDYDSHKSHRKATSNDYYSPTTHREAIPNDYYSPKSLRESASNDYDSHKSMEEPTSNDYYSPNPHEESASNDHRSNSAGLATNKSKFARNKDESHKCSIS